MPGEISTLKMQSEHEYVTQLNISNIASSITHHHIMTACQERLGVLHEQFHHLVGEAAILMVSDTLDRLPTPPTRPQVQEVLVREYGEQKDTMHLLSLLYSWWTLLDDLSTRIGVEAARSLVNAPSALANEVQLS